MSCVTTLSYIYFQTTGPREETVRGKQKCRETKRNTMISGRIAWMILRKGRCRRVSLSETATYLPVYCRAFSLSSHLTLILFSSRRRREYFIFHHVTHPIKIEILHNFTDPVNTSLAGGSSRLTKIEILNVTQIHQLLLKLFCVKSRAITNLIKKYN